MAIQPNITTIEQTFFVRLAKTKREKIHWDAKFVCQII